jgi:serine/threonine protein kinase
MQTHVEIDHEKTKSHGSAQLLFGSFTDNHLKKVPVVVKLKRNGGHLAAESRIYGILKNSRFEKDMLTCFNGYGQGDPPYLVLEDFGSDLASAYRIEYRVRSTILVPQIVEAVNQLHQLGVVHADLKPENIIVSPDYRCKLCDFDSAGRVNESFPRTPQGDLKFSFSWVAPEVFKVYEEERKTRGRQHLSLCHEMDIFPLGLIIDLLSRRDLTCREMMTVLPNPTSDTADHSQLRKYLSNQQELNSLIYCLSHDHAYRHLVEPMISISTKHRLTMQHHSDSVKDYGLTGAYRKTKQQQSELEILKSFRANLNEFLDQHHTKTTESSALQWKYVESQIMSLLDSHEQSVQQMVEKVDTLTTQTMTTIQKTWKEAHDTLSSLATNQDLAELMLTLQGRFDAMESMSIAPTCQGSLNASLITEMNLCLVNLAKSMEANNEKSYGKLCLLENELLAQKDQINEIKNNLHESHMEQMRNSDNIMLKLETLGMVLNNSFQNFHETIDSIKTNDEMKVFCSSLKLEIESKVMELFDGLEKTLDEKSRRSESRLESIQAEMVKLAEISQKGVEKNEENSEGLKKRQEELHVVLKTIDERLQKDKEEFETKLLNLQGAIIDSIVEKLENSQDSLATQLDSGVKETMEHVLEKRLGEILSNVKSLGDDLKLSDEELSKLISETKEKVQAVRNFQDLSAFNAHNHPLLFILSEERVKDGAINSMMDAVTKTVRQGYRVHFLCTVCGKMAPSGKHGGKERTKYLWDRAKNSMSHIELDQGGYRLMITRRWVEDFLTGMKWVLRALQFAGRLSGLPLPHLTEFLDFLPIPDSFREMSDQVLNEVRDITRSLCDLTDEDRDRDGREILRDNDTLGDDSDSDDGNGNNNGADPVDKAEVKRLKRSARKDSQSNYHKLITAEDMRRNWDKHRPKVSLTDVKLVKQLLEFVGDHDVEHTGLRRSLRALDGTCAWVCDNNDRSLMCGADPTDTRSCYELYQAEGSKCCLIDLNYV